MQPPPAFSLPPANSSGFAAAELGMKLTCGFEMLCASGKPSPASTEVPALVRACRIQGPAGSSRAVLLSTTGQGCLVLSMRRLMMWHGKSPNTCLLTMLQPPQEKPDVDSPSWREFLAAAQRHDSPSADPTDDPVAAAERRFAAMSAYQQAADSLVRPVEHVDRLMQVPICHATLRQHLQLQIRLSM